VRAYKYGWILSTSSSLPYAPVGEFSALLARLFLIFIMKFKVVYPVLFTVGLIALTASAFPGHKDDDDDDDYWNYAVKGHKDPPDFDKKAQKDCEPEYECCLGRNCKPGYYCADHECHRYYPKYHKHHKFVSFVLYVFDTILCTSFFCLHKKMWNWLINYLNYF